MVFEVPNTDPIRLPLTVAVAIAATLTLSAVARGQLAPVPTSTQPGSRSQPEPAAPAKQPQPYPDVAAPAASAAQLAQTPASAQTQPILQSPQPTPPVDSQGAPPAPRVPGSDEPTIQFPVDGPAQPTEPAPQVEPPTPDNQTAPVPPPAPGAEQTEPLPQPVPPAEVPPLPQGETPSQPPDAPEPQVLVSEVVVEGVGAGLQNEVYQAIQTQPGRTTTRSQLQEDINAVFATGYFADVRAEPSDTPLGVRVTFVVQPNPVLQAVQVQGNQVLTQAAVNQIFRPQYGQTLNFRRLQAGIRQLNQFYQSRGYVLGQVVGAPQVSPNGTVTLQVAEGQVEDVRVRYLNEEGQPIEGKTRPFIITREFTTLKPGNVLNRNQVQADLRRVFELGIFEDVQLALEPGQDPRRVVAVVNVQERKSGSVGFGAGFSSSSGIFGSLNYSQQNLGGNNQKLNAIVQGGPRLLDFDINFTDPWIAGDPFRTSYTANIFRRRTRPFVFDGGDVEVNLPPDFDDNDDNNDGIPDDGIFDDEGDSPRIVRLGSGVSFTRPLSGGWTVSVGPQYQRVSARDADGDISPFACIPTGGNEDTCDVPLERLPRNRAEPLTFSGSRDLEDGVPLTEASGVDDLFLLQASVARDRRDNVLTPTKGSLLRFGTEQSVPFGSGSILLNRLRGSYSYYIPVRFTRFNDGPQALAFNIQAGTVFGDLPPYEAFVLGGSNTVRGYEEGEVGAGRRYIQATAEYRFPVFSAVGGVLFADFATDLGSGDTVPGDPAGVRGKPGNGFGYGIGVRVRSPLGAIRLDYGFNDEGGNQLHFGIGERF